MWRASQTDNGWKRASVLVFGGTGGDPAHYQGHAGRR